MYDEVVGSRDASLEERGEAGGGGGGVEGERCASALGHCIARRLLRCLQVRVRRGLDSDAFIVDVWIVR